MASNHALFLGEFIRNPIRTAALAPSSATLAAQMITQLQPNGETPVVVELGPGTGAFTEAIQHRLNGRGMHLAIELNERLAGTLTDRYPKVDVVTANATSLPKLLSERGHAKADFVVSGLPWAAYAGPDGEKLIDTVAGLLKPHGAFTQFAYVWSRWAPPARKQLRQLRDAFQDVRLSEIVWANMPPAVVYTARKPRLDGAAKDTAR